MTRPDGPGWTCAETDAELDNLRSDLKVAEKTLRRKAKQIQEMQDQLDDLTVECRLKEKRIVDLEYSLAQALEWCGGS